MYCLLGSPVAHSISPLIHNYSFNELGINGAYLAYDIKKEEIGAAISALKLLNCGGFNLTMPLKEVVIPHLDDLSEAAKLTGSVNVVQNLNGKLVGHNTDGIGFVRSIEEYDFRVANSTITLLGAGGAAKSILAQLAIDGAKTIYVFKRKNDTFETFKSFCENINKNTLSNVVLCDFSDTNSLMDKIAKSDILVNATNIGMSDDPSSPVPKEAIRNDLFVADIIYHPRETTLLRYAKEVGATYTNGLYMLLYQAAEAFKIWTGNDMPIELLKKDIINKEL